MIRALPSKSTTAIFKAEWLSVFFFFFCVSFSVSRREQMERERFSIKEYFNLLGGNYEYKAACECLAACSS